MIWEAPAQITPQAISDVDWQWFEPLFGHLKPPGFVRRAFAGWFRPGDDLVVMISGRTEADGRRWVHVSASHKNRTPTWEKMCEVKRLFLGDRRALQIHPSEGEYVNLHPYCLHLWCCLDDDGLPDFRVATEGGPQV